VLEFQQLQTLVSFKIAEKALFVVASDSVPFQLLVLPSDISLEQLTIAQIH